MNNHPTRLDSRVPANSKVSVITIQVTLRLIFGLIFALVAFIFSELLPDIPGAGGKDPLRILVTLVFALIGLWLYPTFARWVTYVAISIFNATTTRVTNDVVSQIIRLPAHQPLNVPYTNHAPVSGVSINQPMILDTSAIIDGRILDIAKTGFLFGTVLVPSFVLTELQQVADSSDYIKRSRGRRGFEIIEELKKVKGLRVEIWDKDIMVKAVDDKLIKLAKSLNGRIITTDYNLNRVASVSGVTVLNFNDLANAVKTSAIPGEQIKIKVIHLGKDPKQGVGYLQDGTMIVVEDGAELVGHEIKAEVTRTLQVSAGKMIFAKKI